jgi:hypothetical protein
VGLTTLPCKGENCLEASKKFSLILWRRPSPKLGCGAKRRERDKLPITVANFEAFTAVMFQVEVFWVVTPCGVVVGYRRFRGPCCLSLH